MGARMRVTARRRVGGDSRGGRGGKIMRTSVKIRSAMANKQGFGHRAPALVFVSTRKKPLSQLTAADVPPGLEPEDVASDYAPKSDQGQRSVR